MVNKKDPNKMLTRKEDIKIIVQGEPQEEEEATTTEEE